MSSKKRDSDPYRLIADYMCDLDQKGCQCDILCTSALLHFNSTASIERQPETDPRMAGRAGSGTDKAAPSGITGRH